MSGAARQQVDTHAGEDDLAGGPVSGPELAGYIFDMTQGLARMSRSYDALDVLTYLLDVAALEARTQACAEGAVQH